MDGGDERFVLGFRTFPQKKFEARRNETRTEYESS